MKWNQFDKEIESERHMLRDYGRICPPRCGDSFKEQAKRELALRLLLEDKVHEMNREREMLLDVLENHEETGLVPAIAIRAALSMSKK